MIACENAVFAIQCTQTRTMRRTAVNMFGILDKMMLSLKNGGFNTKSTMSMYHIDLPYLFIVRV